MLKSISANLSGQRIKIFFILIFLISLIYFAFSQRQVTIYTLKLPSGNIFILEDPNNRQLIELRKSEQIDSIVKLHQNDLDKLLALAQWTAGLFKASTPFPNYPPWDARKILSMIRKKETGGFCAQYAIIFGQVCQSLGYPVRYVDLANKNTDSTHFLTEIYILSLHKWVAFEPEFGKYYINRSGIPLSVMEIHEYSVNNKKEAVFTRPEQALVSSEQLSLFFNFRYYLRNNYLSVPVYVAYVTSSGQTQVLFETYRLRWLDKYTKEKKGSNQSFESADKNDYDFNVDLNKYVEVKCDSIEDFLDLFGRSKVGVLHKVHISGNDLKLAIERILNDRSYQPLSKK